MLTSRLLLIDFGFVGRSYSQCFSSGCRIFWIYRNVNKKYAGQLQNFRNICSTRALSVITPNVISSPEEISASEEERQGFKSTFADIIRDFTESDQYSDIPEVTKHFARVLEYNVASGSLKRLHALMNAYRELENPDHFTPERIRLAYILGCCFEMIHVSLLMPDDIMDGSKNRRGLPCWYLNEGVGLTAINDSMTVMSSVHAIIRKYFSRLQCYIPILEVINDIILKTTMGQTLDNTSAKNEKFPLEFFTTERYRRITKYKTAHLIYQLPVSLALYLTNVYQAEVHQNVKPIAIELGHHYQAENDIKDCYGNPGIKQGTDIREGKCTWLIVEALERANPRQRRILETNYGKPVFKCEQAIRNLYDEMNMLSHYCSYKEESFETIHTLIHQTLSGRLQKVMYGLLSNQFGTLC